MEADELRTLVLEFLKAVEKDTHTNPEDEGAEYMDVAAMLCMWMQSPDCEMTAMFLGWTLAKGVGLTSFTPEELEKAVQTALVGDNKNIMFDWLGDTDASQKPH